MTLRSRRDPAERVFDAEERSFRSAAWRDTCIGITFLIVGSCASLSLISWAVHLWS